MKLLVKVVPGSSRDGIVGWLGDALKIRVSVPAEKGKANMLVVKILADALDIRKDSIEIITGRTSPRKIIQINGLSEPEIHQRIVDLLQ